MELNGNLIKMKTAWNNPVDYYLSLEGQEVYLNPLINHEILLVHNGIINCIHCGKKTNKSFNQGFCYNCFSSAPEADESVFRPELSKAHLGIARDMEWSKQHDLIDHFVYIATTSNIKVGVTRSHHVPGRWIDQGASRSVKLAKTPNRHIAGIIEVFLKKYVADKTNWQTMLKGGINDNTDLLEEKEKLIGLLPVELKKYACTDDTINSFSYPGFFNLSEIKTVSFDKEKTIKGILTGIKGQYMIFDNEKVLNVRKHNGYFINFKTT